VLHFRPPADKPEEAPAWGTTSPWPLPSYQPWRCLGVGARCETWLVWDTAGWSRAVVKLVRPDHVGPAGDRARRALDREAACAATPHAGLARLLADGRGAGVPHLVFEHLGGPALDATVADDGRLTDTEAALLAAGLLSALTALHRSGRAHCDVKPANVVLRDGLPVLVDLGSARRLGSLQPTGRPLGTPGYAAPEMEACAPIAAGMDVYGVAVTVAEARTGRSPLADRWGPAAFARWPRRSRLRPVVEQMLCPEPEHRPTLTASLRLVAGLLTPDQAPWPEAVHRDLTGSGWRDGGPKTIARWRDPLDPGDPGPVIPTLEEPCPHQERRSDAPCS
jgi:serine/threonine protein kinase